jgi:ribosomal protein S18 acetylase RimI-like enzyme
MTTISGKGPYPSRMLRRMTEVRAARDSDVDAICDICARGYRATYPGLLRPEFLEWMLTEFFPPERIGKDIAADPPGWLGYQVAEEDGVVLGAAVGGLIAPRSGELFVLYLDPEQRGRGLGTLLLDRVTEQLREQGATEMWAAVLEGNDLAFPFYEARGFRRAERRRTTHTDEADNLFSWRMRRPI